MKKSLWPIMDFTGGINNLVDENLIEDNQCVDAQNVIVNIVGRLNKRRGIALLNSEAQLPSAITGLHGYYYGAGLLNRKLIVAAEGKAYRWDGPGFTELKTGLSNTSPTMFATCVNYMVSADGVNPPWKYDGTNATPLANAPATLSCPILHYEKLFGIVDAETIRWSDSFEPETWPGVNEWVFDPGDGDVLTGLFIYGKSLLACKERRFFTLHGSSMDDFRLGAIEANYGVVGPRAGITVEPHFYYVSHSGIMKWDGLKSVELTKVIPQTWARVNKTALSKAVVFYYNNQLWFCLPENESTTNNLVLVYDLKFSSWWIFRGLNIACFEMFLDGGTATPYVGDSALGNINQIDTGYNDNGIAISSYWIGKKFDAGDPVRLKKFKKAFVVDAEGLNDVVYSYQVDLDGWQTPVAKTDRKNVRCYSILNGKGRYYQPRFAHDVLDQDFAVLGHEVQYKIKKPK